MKKPLKAKGLTLIEIIISLAILSIVIAPLGNLALTSVRIEKDSNEKLKANAIGQQLVEYIKESSVELGALDTYLGSGDLNLEKVTDSTIKDALVDVNSGEETKNFLFYETEVKNCYVRVGVSQIEYNPSLVNPKNEKTSIWKNTNFQYRIKIAKDNSSNLKLYDVSGAQEIYKTDLNKHATSTILNITDDGQHIFYNIHQDGEQVFSVNPKDIAGQEPQFNLQIQENCPSIIVNVENQDEARSLKLFVDELVEVDKEEYTSNYKVFSKGKVGVYTKMNKQNESFSDVKKIYKIEVNIYRYKNADKTLLQNLTDYKYIKND